MALRSGPGVVGVEAAFAFAAGSSGCTTASLDGGSFVSSALDASADDADRGSGVRDMDAQMSKMGEEETRADWLAQAPVPDEGQYHRRLAAERSAYLRLGRALRGGWGTVSCVFLSVGGIWHPAAHLGNSRTTMVPFLPLLIRPLHFLQRPLHLIGIMTRERGRPVEQAFAYRS
jgi:hypothetical protein